MVDRNFMVYGDKELLTAQKKIALTIGNFDGVHLGHIHVLKTLRDFANERPTVALTFEPHPSSVISPQTVKPSLVSLEERIDLLLKSGVDAVVVQKFSAEFAKLSADEFISDYLLKNFNIFSAVIGFDFCYGSNRQGDWAHFEESARRFSFEARQSTPLIVEGSPVSSSRIRAAVLAKDFRAAARLLGRDFRLSGIVVQGDQRGRLIGFPTANLDIEDENCLIPPYGVYAVDVHLPGELQSRPGVMNCGVRPTIATGLKLQIEAHILDYSGDLYGCEVSFSVRKFIRTEMKFSDLEHLKSQIQNDVNQARLFFGV